MLINNLLTLPVLTGYFQGYRFPSLCLKSIANLKRVLPSIIDTQLCNVKVTILRDTNSFCFFQSLSFERPDESWFWIFGVTVV